MKNVRRAAQGLGVIPIIGLITHLLVLCFCSASCHEGFCPPASSPVVHAAKGASESGPSCCAHETSARESHIECCECPGPAPELTAHLPAPAWDLPVAALTESPLELPPVQAEPSFTGRPQAVGPRAPPPWLETHGARAPPPWLETHGARAPPFPLV